MIPGIGRASGRAFTAKQQAGGYDRGRKKMAGGAVQNLFAGVAETAGSAGAAYGMAQIAAHGGGMAGVTGAASAAASAISAAAVANPITAAVGAAAVAGYGLYRLGKWAFGSRKSTVHKQRIEGPQHVGKQTAAAQMPYFAQQHGEGGPVEYAQHGGYAEAGQAPGGYAEAGQAPGGYGGGGGGYG